MPTIFRLALMASVLSLLSACAELGQVMQAADIRKPTVQVSAVNISSLTLEEIGLDLALAVDNPNLIPVKLAGFDYTLLINGQQLTSGQQRQGINIAAKDQSTVHIPLQLRFAELSKLVKGFGDAQEFSYQVQGNALVDLPVLGTQSLPAQTSGTLPVPKLPEIALAGIKVRKMGLTGADLEVGIAVKNPNAFAIDISQFAYQLNVNGKPWINSRLAQVLSLTQQGDRQVNVPLHLNLVEIGSTLASAISQSAPLNYQLNGKMNFDTSLPLLKGVDAPFDFSGQVAVQK